MIRVFFGYLYSCDVASDWIDACGFDHTFPMFLEGTQNTVDVSTYNVHNRVPQAFGYTGITAYREYVDLFHASIDDESNQMTSEFMDLAGVIDFVQFETDDSLSHGSYLRGGVINKIVLESWAEEFLGTTKRLDYPVPDAARANTPKLYAENLTLAADPSLPITGYRAFSITIDPSVPALAESYASKEVYVPINATTDDIFIAYYSAAAYTAAVIRLYRATVDFRLENTKRIYRHSDFTRKCSVNLFSGAILAGWNPVNSVAPNTLECANEATYPYSDKLITSFCPFEPDNPIIARIGCDIFNRNRAGLGINWLVLNTDTHKYYKCIILEASTLFIEGYNQVSDKSAQITLGVKEEGSFVDAALTSPTTATYFTAVERDYTNAP